MFTKEQRDEILRIASRIEHASTEESEAHELANFHKYLDSITVPEWNPTDEELTTIYKMANNEVGKGKPITTQRIFTAMRAMLTSAPKPGDSNG